jgi:integrase
MKAADKSMKESESVDPPSCPFQCLSDAAEGAEPWARAALQLSWLTAARTGCILQLKKHNLTYEASTGALKVNFRRGKGVAFRGPYTVPTAVPPAWRKSFKAFLATRKPDEFLFPAASAKDRMANGRVLLEALRAVDPSMGQRAIRRGALQHMAREEVPLPTLMLFSGHKSEDTLRRYLRWGLDAEEPAHRARDAARLLGGPTSGAKRRTGPTSA